MRERIEQLVTAFEASLDDGTATAESFQQVAADIGGLESITEFDRLAHLSGTVRLFDAVLTRLPAGEGASLREQREKVAALVERKYGSNAPYARSRDIVQEVATKLKDGDDTDVVADAAIAEITALPFDEVDADEKGAALLAVHALRAATDWLVAYSQSPGEQNVISTSLKLFATAFDAGGFDKDAAIKSATHIREGRLSFDGTQRGHLQALMVSVGLALRAEPMALPALTQPLLWLVEAVNDLQTEANAETEPTTTSPAVATTCATAISQFQNDLQAHGFTEYHLRQAMASLQELSPDTPADRTLVRDTLLQIFDIAIPHAPREFAEMLPIVKRQIIAQDEPAGAPMNAAAFENEGQGIVERLRADLAGGALPTAAFAQAQLDLQTLSNRLPDDDDEAEVATRALMRLMPELVAAMAPYAEKGKQNIAVDTVSMIRHATANMDGAFNDDPAMSELSNRAALHDVQSMMSNPLGDPFEQPGAPLYQRQFAALIRSLTERTLGTTKGALAGRDIAEWESVQSRMNIANSRIAAATTEEQWIDQQRGSLRGAVLGLRRFERRHHLMVIAPPWSRPRTNVNANAVFVSGGPSVQSLVDEAGRKLGYETAIVPGVNDPTQARWDMLNRSAIAVFDFTSYDAAASDPAEIPSSPDAFASVARAAAATARAAYECGWAFVLGVATVVVAREGQFVPFDIDVEPVRLAGDAADIERVGVALQAALFGTQRGVTAEGLSGTIDYLGSLAARDATAARLVAAAKESGDATSVRLAAEGVLERLHGHRFMLTLPAFPPAYPPEGGRKALFHVTAFRPWSEACQRVVQEACGDTIERRIGYERFDPDIIRSIWNDIATASYVVADLTHLNPNAVLELAIAQALGRPTLVVSQTPNLHEYLPPISKVRIHTYTTDAAGLRTLRAAVDRFVASVTDR